MNKQFKFLLVLLFFTGLTACEQKVKFESAGLQESVFETPECVAPQPRLVGSTTVEVDEITQLEYTDSKKIFWYIILPDGEQIFEGPKLNISVNQVGTYPAAVWGLDSCDQRKQINFDLVIVPALKNPFIAINNNDATTGAANVTLQLTAESATEMYVTNEPSCGDGGVWEPYAIQKNWVLAQEAVDSRVYVKYKNGAKETSCVSDGILFDKTPPSVNFVKVPPANSFKNSVDFEFEAFDAVSGIKGIECSVNSSSYQACSSPYTLTNLNYGSYLLEIRALDNMGLYSQIKSHSWEYVNLAPQVKIVSAPVSSKDTSARFEFIANDDSGVISRYECQIDQGAAAPCTSPQVYTNLAVGAHSFKVVAYDNVGQASLPATHAWDVQKIPPPPSPPTVNITKAPDAVTFDTFARFEFVATHSGVGIDSFYCKIDQAPFVQCSSPVTYNLNVGAHNFSVYAIDKNGLKSATKTHSWKIDKKRIPYNDVFVVDSSYKKIDVVVIIDNSPSMKEEQQKMAQRFKSFIDKLKDLDWQVGIITTDARTGTKPWQDGRLLPFEGLDKTYAIDVNTPNVEAVFAKTIRRKETGSSNEEGIHSFLKSIQRVDNRFFFRPNSHIASIVVSDEDERSNGKKLKAVNQPENLISKVNETFKDKNTYSHHSIVLPSGSVSTKKCPQVGDYFAGETYMRLSRLTNGVIGNLCDDDYGPLLGQIGEDIRNKTFTVLLKCEPTTEPVIQISPAPTKFPEVELKGRQLTLKPHPEAGSKVEVEYYCD